MAKQTAFGFDEVPEVKGKTPEEEMREFWGEPISVYTRDQAIEDGYLVQTGEVETKEGKISVCFTSNLFSGGGYDRDPERRKGLVLLGIQKLKEKDRKDTDTMKLRVLVDSKDPEKRDIWCVLDGDGITFERPEDY